MSTCDRPRRASWDRKAMHDHASSSQPGQNDTKIPRWREEWTGSKRRNWRSTCKASSRGSPQTGRPSELVLEGLCGEGLHDGLGRLRLHHDDFAEDLALPGLSRLLLAGLDHHNTGDDELAVLLRLHHDDFAEDLALPG